MKKIKLNIAQLIYFLGFGFLFFHLAKQMLQIKADGWYVGQVNLYGDLVFHIGFINKLIESNSYLPQSHIFSGNKPNYPIFVDLATAKIAQISNLDFSLFISTFLGGILVIFLIRMFIFNFIKNEKVVLITLIIFFINGGFGFYYFFQDLFTSQQSITSFLTSLPREYTDIKEEGYWWINSLLAYFIPQRGFLYAFPITLSILSLLYIALKKSKLWYFILAGFLAGILPLVQAHSLFVIFLLCILYTPASIISLKFNKNILVGWSLFALVTTATAVPIFLTISSANNPLQFFRFDLGWTSEENVFWFWFKNLGLFAPVLIISMFWLFKKNKELFLFYLPFLFLFVISNLAIFQPWEFDNSKILIYWFFASAILVSYYLYEQFLSREIQKKLLGLIIIFLLVFSGSLDLFRTFTPVTSYQIFSNKDLNIAQSVKNLTDKNSIFITSSNHNHPIPSLSGRSTLLGFHGWVWSHGLNYKHREADIKIIYLGEEQSAKLIDEYKINYVTIGPLEREEFSINTKYFEQFSSIQLDSGWTIYDVSNLWSDSNR